MKKLNYLLVTLAMTTMCMSCGEESGKPKGVDRANLDETVAPSHDFYQYACGGWIKNNPLQPQYSRFGQFDLMAENNKEQLKELIQGLAKKENEQGSVAQKVNDLYLQGLDSVRLNEEGAAPLKADLEKINSVAKGDLMNVVAWLHSEGIASPFFNEGIDADLMNSNENALYFMEAGRGLGERDYYLENDSNSVKIRNAYVDFMKKLFTLSGYDVARAEEATANVMKIETSLAKVAMNREEQRNIAGQYNPRTYAQLKKDYPNIGWDVLMESLGLKNVENVILGQPRSFAEVNKLLGELNEQEMKDYLSACYIRSAASYLSDEYVDAKFELFGKTMSGKKEQEPRWKRALSVPNGLLGMAVGQLYVEKYFAGESKMKMLMLVDNLKASLAEHIKNLTWMTEETKKNAIAKLNKFKVKIGYPDTWKDYSAIDVNKDDYYWSNIKKAMKWHAEDNLAKYGKPVDKEEWLMTPQTVNAYYNPTSNEICFPAGILQAPYFDVNADDASNYGAIGVVIGHEMTHGFDDQGRQFDKDGNMIDWWTAEDAKKFNELTDVLVAQFDSIEVAEGVNANGRYTLGENIADQGGLRVAYTAFKRTAQGISEELIDGFTSDQRFYLAYANVWAANITEQEILLRTKTDVHSLGKWRVNATLRNIDTFFEAFGVKEGDAMYRPEEERVIIW